MNEIKIKNLNSQYSKITVIKTLKSFEYPNDSFMSKEQITKHIISNRGWFDLDYWIYYFTNKY